MGNELINEVKNLEKRVSTLENLVTDIMLNLDNPKNKKDKQKNNNDFSSRKAEQKAHNAEQEAHAKIIIEENSRLVENLLSDNTPRTKNQISEELDISKKGTVKALVFLAEKNKIRGDGNKIDSKKLYFLNKELQDV